MAVKVFVNEMEMRQVQTQLMETETYFTAGTSSIFVPSQAKKYVNKKVCQLWEGLEGGKPEFMTPGEAARTELLREFVSIKRIGWAKGHTALFDKRPPHEFNGSYKMPMVYIDLVGAYHQLYKRLWLDAPYPRAIRGRYPLRPIADRLQQWKPARNAVMGIAFSRTIVGVRGKKRSILSIKNQFLSPFLWATVQDLLHWVAREAIRHGAVYVNTDGYIFPLGSGYEQFFEWLVDYGLHGDIRAIGDGEIRGWNCYKIGDYETKVFSMDLPFSNKEFSNVGYDTRRWAKFWKRVRFSL